MKGINKQCHRIVISSFLGEVTIDLAQSPLDEEAEWHYLTTYKNGLPDHLVSSVLLFSLRSIQINFINLQKGSYGVGDDAPSSLARYTPPLVASRYSESPVSDFEDGYSLYRDCLEQVDDIIPINEVSTKIMQPSGWFLPSRASRGRVRPELAVNFPRGEAAEPAHQQASPGP